jgi:hypothetical protein
VLIVGTLLLGCGVLAQRFQVGRHLLDGVGEFGQLTGNGRYVLGGCDSTRDPTTILPAAGVILRPPVDLIAQPRICDEADKGPRGTRAYPNPAA